MANTTASGCLSGCELDDACLQKLLVDVCIRNALSVDDSIRMESWVANETLMEDPMKKFFHGTRFIREIIQLVAAVLKVAKLVIEIVNEAVNCSHDLQLQV